MMTDAEYAVAIALMIWGGYRWIRYDMWDVYDATVLVAKDIGKGLRNVYRRLKGRGPCRHEALEVFPSMDHVVYKCYMCHQIVAVTSRPNVQDLPD
jgi:hypothetical protein